MGIASSHIVISLALLTRKSLQCTPQVVSCIYILPSHHVGRHSLHPCDVPSIVLKIRWPKPALWNPILQQEIMLHRSLTHELVNTHLLLTDPCIWQQIHQSLVQFYRSICVGQAFSLEEVGRDPMSFYSTVIHIPHPQLPTTLDHGRPPCRTVDQNPTLCSTSMGEVDQYEKMKGSHHEIEIQFSLYQMATQHCSQHLQ